MTLLCLPALAAYVLFVSCSTTTTISRAPAALTELFDSLGPDGALELEFERDGTFLDLEAEVPLESMPELVRSAVLAGHPGVELASLERELQSGQWTYEVGFEGDKGEVQVVVTPGGTILETEEELPVHLWPESVLAAAERALPGTTFVRVDVITAPDTEDHYHVKSERDGARFKVVVSASGAVLRRVREVPAEIEIPLPDPPEDPE